MSNDIPPGRRLHLSDLSALQHEYYTIGESTFAPHNILLVRYSGSYGYGSAGNGDAAYILATLEAGLAAWQPRGIVLDLSQLFYQFGNALAGCFALRQRKPLAVVVGPSCAAAVRSLLQASDPFGTPDPAPPDWLFDDIQLAIRYANNQAK